MDIEVDLNFRDVESLGWSHIQNCYIPTRPNNCTPLSHMPKPTVDAHCPPNHANWISQHPKQLRTVVPHVIVISTLHSKAGMWECDVDIALQRATLEFSLWESDIDIAFQSANPPNLTSTWAPDCISPTRPNNCTPLCHMSL